MYMYTCSILHKNNNIVQLHDIVHVSFVCRSLLDLQPDVMHQPVIGPALRVGEHLLTWKGPPPSRSAALQPSSKLALHGRATQSESALKLTSKAQLTSTSSLMDLPSPIASQLQLEFQQKYVYQQPIELRVNFQGKPNEITASFLEMENCGTAAVYYSWQVTAHYNHVRCTCRWCTWSFPLQLLPKSNPLQTIQAGTTQRFYFDTRGGELERSETVDFTPPPPFLLPSPSSLSHLTFQSGSIYYVYNVTCL